jgi:hypothetical protein
VIDAESANAAQQRRTPILWGQGVMMQRELPGDQQSQQHYNSNLQTTHVKAKHMTKLRKAPRVRKSSGDVSTLQHFSVSA